MKNKRLRLCYEIIMQCISSFNLNNGSDITRHELPEGALALSKIKVPLFRCIGNQFSTTLKSLPFSLDHHARINAFADVKIMINILRNIVQRMHCH